MKTARPFASVIAPRMQRRPRARRAPRATPGRAALACLGLLLLCTACSKQRRPAHGADAGGAGTGARGSNHGGGRDFGNQADGGGGQSSATNSAVKAPGGCVRPGELNEFHLPLCPMMDASTVPNDKCKPGFDEFGRPVCLDDAGMPKPPPPPHCIRGGLCKALLLAGSGQLDVLFMVDDSSSMHEEQQALVTQMPRLIAVLTSGDLNGDGVQEVPAVKDLHLGVVSSDMGLEGMPSTIQNCVGLGDDGVLRHTPATGVTGCAASYPPFLSYDASHVDPNQAASEFACIATLGTNGCGFEQQLEATLKAVTPSSSDLRFLGDATGTPTLGHANGANKGFLREDSLVALVLVTDEDDCSARETRLFTLSSNLDPMDTLSQEPINLRCLYNKDELFDVARYVNGFAGIRPPGSNLVLFAAIVGVPPELVDAHARAGVDFHDATARDAYYDGLLAAPAMQEQVDPATVGFNEELLPSCNTSTGTAYPPRRIVEVAKGFGEDAVVQSICQDNFKPALEPIVERISASLTVGCLPQAFARDTGGKVACDVIWELPVPKTPNASLTLCEERGFLAAPEDPNLRTSPDGRTRCIVTQVPVLSEDDGGAPGPAVGAGWYYDDFSSEATDRCGGASHQRVVFTDDVHAPSDVRVYVDCDVAP